MNVVKIHKFPVKDKLSIEDVIYSMMTVVNTAAWYMEESNS